MSLNWNLGKIKDWESVCKITAQQDQPMDGIKKGDRILSPVTNQFIWATMIVGMGEITEKNADEFYSRIHLIETTSGAFLNKPTEDGGWEPRPLTLAEVRAHIGLSTNVTYEPQAKWLKRTFEYFSREALSEAKSEKKAA